MTIVTFVYFSEGQLKHTLWPTLTLLKIAQVPIIERFEYIVVSLWLLVVLPTITLHLWSACRGVRKCAVQAAYPAVDFFSGFRLVNQYNRGPQSH